MIYFQDICKILQDYVTFIFAYILHVGFTKPSMSFRPTSHLRAHSEYREEVTANPTFSLWREMFPSEVPATP